MQEHEFFSSENVYVSTTRFIVFGQTYAMSGITAVKAAEIRPSRLGPLLMAALGLFLLLAGGNWLIAGLVLIVGAGLIAHAQSPTYCVYLSSASGEVKALRSESYEFISDVVQALNDCIVARG